MALETLKNVPTIGKETVKHMDTGHLRASMIEDGLKKEFSGNNIVINDKLNIIAFRLQNGPIKTNGKNGCQVDDILLTVMQIIQGLDKQFPCSQNQDCLKHLNDALESHAARRQNRETRGVEGYNKA